MPSIEETFEAAVAAKVIPGAVVVASSKDGLYSYAKSFGLRSLKEGAPPMELDTLLWLGSCTKLLTAIAALQCVERGYFTLDEDVTRLLPELKDIDIKTTDGTMVRAKNTITLRHLLTHTSGLSYTKFGQLSLPLLERCLAPLVFEPGEGFIYGTGTDFAGFMIERVTGVSLEKFIQDNVGAPLGIKSICFRPRDHPELFESLADVSFRKEKDGPVEWTTETIWPLDTPEDSGGSGAYATLVDYQEILHSLVADDGKLLTSPMVDALFAPEMKPVVREGVKQVLKNPTTNNIYGGLPQGVDVTYSMGGMIVLEDLKERRPKMTLHWGGLFNLFFWMDRTNGLSGIFGSQVFPAGDVHCLGLFAEFERKTYEAYRACKQ